MVPVYGRSGLFHRRRLHTHGSHRSQSDPSGWEGTKTRRNKKARRVPVPHFLFSPERPPSRKQAKRGVDSMMNTAAQAASVFRSWLFFFFSFPLSFLCLPRRRDRRASSTSLLPLFVFGGALLCSFCFLASFLSFLWGAPLAIHGPRTHCSLACCSCCGNSRQENFYLLEKIGKIRFDNESLLGG
jgi:hypothetical protein